MNTATFWWWLTIACLVWYTGVTAYVSVRGAVDIRGMLGRLSASQDEEVATQITDGTENGNKH
jgi:hypothetical protein